MKSPNFIIFSDLDGTLLDHHSYEFREALTALKELKRQNIPLILTSSKTSAEIQSIRLQLQNDHPYIVENGGAVYIPEGYFSIKFEFHKQKYSYLVVELGTTYPILREALNEIKLKTGLSIQGFGDLSPEELASISGLSLAEANLALQREYNEPFEINEPFNEIKLHQLSKLISEIGLNLTKGGRFFHLTGNNDKGAAVKNLISLFKNEFKNTVKVIGIGDSMNDLAMLKAVDSAILVQKPDGKYDTDVLSKIEPELAKGVGPIGWNISILNILESNK